MEIKTVLDIYDHYLDRLGGESSFGHHDGKAWKSITGNEFRERGRRFAAFLSSMGVSKGDKILLISHNRPEWTSPITPPTSWERSSFRPTLRLRPRTRLSSPSIPRRRQPSFLRP